MTVRHSSFTGKIGQSCISYFNRYLELPVIRFVTITFLIMAFVNLAVICLTQKGGMTIYGSWTGGDYSTFYVAGTILNEYPPIRLYDFQLQSRLLHSLLPNIPGTAELPFINPPFFALLFQPLSLLSFIPSFLAWVVISICLYIAGLALIRKTLLHIPANVSIITFLLAISFEPK